MSRRRCSWVGFGPVRLGWIANTVVWPGFGLLAFRPSISRELVPVVILLAALIFLRAYRTGVECEDGILKVKNFWQHDSIPVDSITSVWWEQMGGFGPYKALVIATDSDYIVARGVTRQKPAVEVMGLESSGKGEAKGTHKVNAILSECGAPLLPQT